MTEQIVPYGYCHCGCGQETKLATKTAARYGHIKGQPHKFLHGHRAMANLAKSTAHMRDGALRQCKVCEEWKDHKTGFYRKSGYTCKPCRNREIGKRRTELHGSSGAASRWVRYGLTKEGLEALKAEQAGRCGLCNRRMKPNATAIDHDHQTGRVRALLCYACNAGLGMFKDDPELLRKAIRYVEYHRSTPERW